VPTGRERLRLARHHVAPAAAWRATVCSVTSRSYLTADNLSLAPHHANQSLGAQANLGNVFRRRGRLEDVRVAGVLSRRDCAS